MSEAGAPPVLVEVVRSGFVEGRHRGSAVILNSDGSVLAALGTPEAPCFPRSSNKLMQAVGLLRAGVDLDGELLALAAASHSGEDFHVKGVRRILEPFGLPEEALQTPPDFPIDDVARNAVIAQGGGPQRIFMNCSGKHAAMLAACQVNGWPIASYRDPEHPLQQTLQRAVEDLSRETVTAIAVDGCGAPLYAISLIGLARAFQSCVLAEPGSFERRVADAMRTYPEWVGGTHRDVTAVMHGVPGLLAKDGAEGVYAAALPDGTAIALKIEDGSARARPVVLAAALRSLGISAPVVAEQMESPLLGAGLRVGSVRAVEGLFSTS